MDDRNLTNDLKLQKCCSPKQKYPMRKLAMDQLGVVNQTSFKNQEFTDVKSHSKEIDPTQNFIKDQIECGAESQVQISSENQEMIVVKSQSKAIDPTQKIINNQIEFGTVNQTVSEDQELTDKHLKSEGVKSSAPPPQVIQLRPAGTSFSHDSTGSNPMQIRPLRSAGVCIGGAGGPRPQLFKIVGGKPVQISNLQRLPAGSTVSALQQEPAGSRVVYKRAPAPGVESSAAPGSQVASVVVTSSSASPTSSASSKDLESEPNWVNFDAFISEIKSMEINSTLSQQTPHVVPKQTVVTANVKNKHQPGSKNQNPSSGVTKTWSKSVTSLDNLCEKFPVLCEMIFNNLDDQTLTKCKEVSRKLRSVLEKDRFYSIRVIKGINKNDNGFLEHYSEAWEIVLYKAPITVVKSLAVAIQEYIKTHHASSLYSSDHSPLHFAAYVGLFDICRYIIEKMKDLQPDLWCEGPGTSPLHMAAARGHLNVFKLISANSIESVLDKNCGYTDDDNWTPLHFAAKHGHLDVCKYIIENTGNTKYSEKNPDSFKDGTPLHMAVSMGHLDICKLIVKYVGDKTPEDFYGSTPLHVAAKSGNFEVFKFIFENNRNKNPRSERIGPNKENNGWTPLHFAASQGHLEICKLILKHIKDKSPMNNVQQTPAWLAKRSGHRKVLELFTK